MELLTEAQKTLPKGKRAKDHTPLASQQQNGGDDWPGAAEVDPSRFGGQAGFANLVNQIPRTIKLGLQAAELAQQTKWVEAATVLEKAITLYDNKSQDGAQRANTPFPRVQVQAIPLSAHLLMAGYYWARANRYSESVALTKRAVALLREEASGGDAESTARLAAALNSLAWRLLLHGSAAKGLPLIEEGIKLYRTSVSMDAGESLLLFCDALDTAAGILCKLGREGEAIIYSTEALKRCRTLYEIDPEGAANRFVRHLRRQRDVRESLGEMGDVLKLSQELESVRVVPESDCGSVM